VASLAEIQDIIGKANFANGFHNQGTRLRDELHDAYAMEDIVLESEVTTAEDNLRNYYSMKLALVVTEIAEGVEELRNGRVASETYYLYEDGGDAQARGDRPASVDPMDKPRKPEGLPSELADTVIRVFDLAYEADIDLAGIIAEKLTYNATRPYLHGKKA
jgi:NTP pyrophosphatase (non-canonical NTP hydrolase)